MKWFGKFPPIYVWEGDEWERETDHVIFRLLDDCWCSQNGERVEFPKKTRFMNKPVP